jgi:Ni,Fe-hydrogenase maturation factor
VRLKVNKDNTQTMSTAKQAATAECSHEHGQENGIAIVFMAALVQGDALPARLSKALSNTALENVCHFEISPHQGRLATCLSNHKAAIIIDSTHTDALAGTVSIMDLSAMLDKTTPIKIDSCHGLAMARELRSAKRSGTLPKRVVFFGVEVGDTHKNDGNTKRPADETPPQIIDSLCSLIGKVLETLKRNA